MDKRFNTYLAELRPKFKFWKSPIPPWVNLAMTELGTSEIYGVKDNPRIVEYLAAAKLGGKQTGYIDEIPWCSAFVNWLMQSTGFKSTGVGLARSWLEYGEVLDDPVVGCIVVVSRGTKKWQGHVGILLDYSDDWLYILGGNQGNKVSIRAYARNRLLGYRWPVRK